jgi:transcriptional regulator with XRE-family HTH domain
MNDFREALKTALKRRKWTQVDLATQSGVNKATICTYLGGQGSDLSTRNTARLAKAAGIQIKYIVEKTKVNP